MKMLLFLETLPNCLESVIFVTFQNKLDLHQFNIELVIVAKSCDLTQKMTPFSLILLCNLGFGCSIFLSAKKMHYTTSLTRKL